MKQTTLTSSGAPDVVNGWPDIPQQPAFVFTLQLVCVTSYLYFLIDLSFHRSLFSTI